MPEVALPPALALYRPLPGHTPRSRNDRCKRVHQYAAKLAASASAELKHTLLALRNAADEQPATALQTAARKEFTEPEFLAAVKEIVCIWTYLEAVDQGGEMMPQWLMNYFKLALYAADYLIEHPTSANIMQAYADCSQMDELMARATRTIANHLGFGEHADKFCPSLAPLLENSRSIRQAALKQSLTQELIEL